MNVRHRGQMSLPIVTSILTLTRYLVDKSAQSRKLVQWCFIDPILRDARLLFVNATNMLDGQPTKEKALKNVYDIQKQTILVCALERDNRPSPTERKGKKHYGFDIHACAYIDEMCDNILAQISAYGQGRKPYDRG